MSIRIRRASPADEMAIDTWQRSMEDPEEYLDLHGDAVRDPGAVRQQYLNWLRLPRDKKVPAGWERIDLVAVEDSGAICGFAALNFGLTDPLSGEKEAFVSELHVWPDYRKRGVARGLLEMAEAYALQRGVGYLTLRVAASNTAAIQLYRTNGFAEETIKMTKKVVRHL